MIMCGRTGKIAAIYPEFLLIVECGDGVWISCCPSFVYSCQTSTFISQFKVPMLLWNPVFQKYATGIGIHLTIVSFALFARTLFVREVDKPLRQWLKVTVGVALVSFVLLMATMN